MSYSTLALGSAMALMLYPHTITGTLSAGSDRVIRRNAALMPAYNLLLGLIALLGYVAIAAGVHTANSSSTVPLLLTSMFPAWFAGFCLAAIGIGALVPAAIMSIATANLFTRNLYGELLHRSFPERRGPRRHVGPEAQPDDDAADAGIGPGPGLGIGPGLGVVRRRCRPGRRRCRRRPGEGADQGAESSATGFEPDPADRIGATRNYGLRARIGPATAEDVWMWQGVPPGRGLIRRYEPGERRFYMDDDGGPSPKALPPAWPPGQGPDA